MLTDPICRDLMSNHDHDASTTEIHIVLTMNHGSSNVPLGRRQEEPNMLLDETNSDEEGISFGSRDDDSSLGEEEELAELESRAVSCLRGTVMIVLVSAAAIVSFIVHKTASNTGSVNFKAAFQDASQLAVDGFRESLERKLGAFDSLAVDLGSFAQSTGNEWPRVTLPDFQRRGISMRGLSDADAVTVLPIVKGESTKTEWERYSLEHQDWLVDNSQLIMGDGTGPVQSTHRMLAGISDHVFNESGDCKGDGPFAPLWQTSPLRPGLNEWVNYDMLSFPGVKGGLSAMIESRLAVMGEALNIDDGSSHSVVTDMFVRALRAGNSSSDDENDPTTPIFYPILSSSKGTSDSHVVGALLGIIPWRNYLSAFPAARTSGLVVVVENGCNQSLTFKIGDHGPTFLGSGDHHDVSYDGMKQSVSLPFNETKKAHAHDLSSEYCPYTLIVYPSREMQDSFVVSGQWLSLLAVATVFLIAGLAFYAYDSIVEKRQQIVMDRAVQSTAIVSSLFPEQVRDRLYRRDSMEMGGEDGSITVDEVPPSDGMNGSFTVMPSSKMRLKTFLTESEDVNANGAASKPIADLFPNCTVLFADISGFTAWSSLRDPAQVFTLLEAVYQAFDRIARKRGVFKVETIGDSYVAVTGLPEPQEDHALIMARFARDCRTKMTDVTSKLERSLGPDTGDLRMRFGLHSGPVTAGVLRGEKSRFQLFGDTVNTAARMESTGERDKIQLSQATADLILKAGKVHWIQKREKKVVAKGKGELQTYWLDTTKRSRRHSTGENSRCSISSIDSRSTQGTLGQSDSVDGKSAIWGDEEELPEEATQRSKHQRLIDYNVDLLESLLKQVVARRKMLEMAGRRCSQGGLPPNIEKIIDKFEEGMVIEEVTEVIKLPNFNAKAFKDHVDPASIELDPEARQQLKRYVTIIGAMYRNNPFHNFEHASHVTMSVNKLLQRVVTPELSFKRRSMQMSEKSLKKQIASDLHNYTFGITSDPLTQLGIIFGALIHDVDHWGVSNAQLVKEKVPIAEKYKAKSVAEQNSVDLAWNLLMDEEEYGALQKCLFPTTAEFKRFRQVVVNVVMATDIFDKELSQLRKNRWEKAFAERDPKAPRDPDEENRKATIVIEHIMQAGDVAHTMQHWHVYQKWNRRLFDELYTAYRAGRMEKDPSTFWYEGEMKFFDGYIIPLAKKLKECGVFGVSSDECLNYAIDNRKEWENKGQMIIDELVANYQQREKEEAELRAQAASATASPTRRRRARVSRRRSLITTGG